MWSRIFQLGSSSEKKIVFYVTSGSNAQQVDRTVTNGCKLTKFFDHIKKKYLFLDKWGEKVCLMSVM